MVVLVTASPVFPSKNNFVKALRKLHPEITTIVQNINDRGTSMVLGKRDIVLFGKGYIEDRLCGCTFRISAQSFYQVNPASDVYDLGSPIFDKIELDLPNGKTFTLLAEGASRGAKYIQSAVLNGQTLTEPRFTHSQLMEGGTLVLTMGQRPNRELFA